MLHKNVFISIFICDFIYQGGVGKGESEHYNRPEPAICWDKAG